MPLDRILAAGTAMALVAGTAGAQTTSTTPAPASQTAPPGAAVGAPAAASAGIAQGAKVSDPQGGSVGTIESIDGDFAVLATARSKVRLPKSSFANGANGPVIAMTAAQIDQAAAQAAPPTPAATETATRPNVAKGAAVVDMQGGAVGTVSAVDAQLATVDLASGAKVRLPVTAFGAGANGQVRVAMTAAQLGAAASASGGASQ